MSQRILAVLLGCITVFAVGGWGRTVDVRGPGQSEVVAAVRGIGGDRVMTAPAGFGYTPRTVRLPSGDLAAVAPGGGCSSPIGGSHYDFTDSCRQHDLGYDLLRHADDEGRPLGPWARRAIDAEFADQTMANCHGLALGCRLMAAVYISAVEFNSWRQGYGVPRNESMVRLLTPVAAGLLAGGGLWLLLRSPRRTPWSSWDRPSLAAGAR